MPGLSRPVWTALVHHFGRRHVYPCNQAHQLRTAHCTAGLLDFYVLAPLARVLQRRFSERDFTLRDRLGGGNYGQGGCCLAEGDMIRVAVE